MTRLPTRFPAMMLFVALLPLFQVRADIRSWKADTTGDWFASDNWEEGVVPGTGDDVFITNLNASALLTNSTPALASLTVSRTLIATNWNTVISAATVTILAGGNITTPVAPYRNTESNRVYIACTDLVIAPGGQINVNAKGFGGGWAANNTANSVSAGIGPGASSYGAGAFGGLGGEAQVSSTAYRSGATYQTVSAPTGPGSGGASTDGRSKYWGGNGGGAVRIDASGHVLVNGTISANGGAGTPYSASGSGGAIWISCQTFAGTNGLVSANGLSCYRSGGGGGRIAMHYNSTAQAALPIPEVVFSVQGGQTTDSVGRPWDGDIGSLYFTDTAWLYAPVLAHSGKLYFSTALESIAFNSLVISNGWIRFPEGGYPFTVTNDITVIGSKGRLDFGGFDYYTPCGFWRLNNTSSTGTLIDIGGNLTLTNGGQFTIVSAATNDAAGPAGAHLNVGGTIEIGPDSWCNLFSSPTIGGGALIVCSDLLVHTNGGITASQAGFAGGRNSSGRGYNAVRYGAGGHGGKGGAYKAGSSYVGGAAHGSSNNPVHCGTGGGAGDDRYQNSAGYGGGIIHIQAANHIIVNGTLVANGGSGGYNYSSGGAGGSVNLDCTRFLGSATGVIRANGGSSSKQGGGGGGRIRISRRAQRSAFDGLITVTGGVGLYENGEDGTVVLQEQPMDRGTLLILR